ncbi:M20 family metallopeptidase [Williamsia sp. 1135]|uniref:M20 family metallopeptidase n=1 Tax=Williamsia sp. 1135 TaxID=1889262 RepID=UPI000A1199A5|nr:M20 family metallopeptidase [Williamsia sp. 1135]ORM25954.1 peptidase M20 [Williamsia sp. 1135]
MTDIGRRGERAVRAVAGDLVELSHSLHSEPELAFEEHRSVAKVSELLAGYGFEVTPAVADLPTAFTASYGSGDLVVGLCAEYDALPGMGHACGHNMIAATTVGAARGLAEIADELGITVLVLGTPAEETGGGKIVMTEAGVFDPVAMAMMVHPGRADEIAASSLALADLAIRYTGLESHAAAAPERGRNAADALTVAQVSLGLLRQHLKSGQQLHGIVSDGGRAPNIVAGHSELLYYLRARDQLSLDDLRERAEGCFAAGAMATGCSYEVATVSPTYLELRQDPRLLSAYREAIVELGRPVVPTGLEGVRPLGSTDMGNVSHVMPVIHPLIGIDSGGAGTHEIEFATAAASGSADRAVVDGAVALTATAVHAALDPVLRDELLQAHEQRTGGQPQTAGRRR